ncbi:hypothetical protein [Larkinella soli]|uniref:hypothetical protein n=1 Tax=Larkinella soli TaxID=1770527 RepID=UPI000FFB54B6|nr:hypothetical protein [Larkinella soli]
MIPFLVSVVAMLFIVCLAGMFCSYMNFFHPGWQGRLRRWWKSPRVAEFRYRLSLFLTLLLFWAGFLALIYFTDALGYWNNHSYARP